MARGRTRAAERRRTQNLKAVRNIGIAVAFLAVVAIFYVKAMLAHKSLDNETLCPPDPTSITVLLVDVTDPMNLPQRQDFLNQLDRLRSSIPRYGKLVVYKVDPISDRLLSPVITRCNPGTAKDVSDVTGNPQQVQKQWEEQFKAPLDRTFERMLGASGANRSPILESIQSANLKELQTQDATDKPHRLIIASDLLQNTDLISFYHGLPDAAELTSSQAFSRARTDLRDVDVELWMLQRDDSRLTQPRALIDLWDQIIAKEGGTVQREYTVSG
jgi:hypothetical protein